MRLFLPKNWHYIDKTFTLKDKMTAFLLVVIILASLIFWMLYGYTLLTKPVPKRGGSYTEGIVGQPLYINPLISQTNDADSGLAKLVYSGLLKYDREGKLTNDLAERHELSEDKKTYILYLKEGVLWHDGEPFSADDVIFTVNALKDSAYKSPLRENWRGVEVSKKDKLVVEFKLEFPYFGFLNNLTLGILPRHIWENISPENFFLASYNMEPIGTGPYEFFDYQKDSNGTVIAYSLESFDKYFEGEAYISKFTFNFYPGEDALIAAYNKKEIDGMSVISPQKAMALDFEKSTSVYEISTPYYFSVFLNQTKNVAIAYDEVRKAINHATDREKIVSDILFGRGKSIQTPFTPDMKGFSQDKEIFPFDLEKANAVLEESDWKKNEEGVRMKDDVKLEFELLTVDWPESVKIAEELAVQWKEIGANVSVVPLSVSDLRQNYIRPREYDALLYGQGSNLNDPDLYSFWHSGQGKDSGKNLALFKDEKADELLNEINQEMDNEKRVGKYGEFQDIINKENPAVFIYTSFYLYPVNSKIKGIEVKSLNNYQDRFSGANHWYVKTKRIRK